MPMILEWDKYKDHIGAPLKHNVAARLSIGQHAVRQSTVLLLD